MRSGLIDRVNVNQYLSREHLFAQGMMVVLTMAFVALVVFSGGKASMVALFPLTCALLLIISNFKLSLVALVVSLFVDHYVWPFNNVVGYSSSVLFSLPVGLSFLLRQRDIEWKEFANPMTIPILFYGVCIIPSFFNATKPFASLAALLNVVAFLIVLYATVATVRTRADLHRLVAVYLGLVLVNSLHVFVQSAIGWSRPFGFAGIMFVDYVGLGICVTAAMSIVSQGKSRLILLFLSTLFSAALVLTKTRNTWLSTIITLAILVGYLMFRPEVASLSRKRLLVMILLGSLGLASGGALVVSLNPQIVERATELTSKSGVQVYDTGEVQSSLISRLFIWDTALNAFRAHPYIGIGVYAFPTSSRQYYTIPRALYNFYVAGLTPHQTHLAVLAETGIIGALGFVVFLVAALKCAFKAIKLAEDRGRKYAIVGAIGVVYCTVSMIFTDAWLWGQGIVLLALVMGLMLANRNVSIFRTERGLVV